MRASRKRRRRLTAAARLGGLAVAALYLVLASGCTDSAPRKAPEPGLDYIEMVSAGADPASPLPMIVAIHGLGATPENFLPVFEGLTVPARIILPRGPKPQGDGYSWFEMAAGTDRTRALLEAADEVSQFIEVMTHERPTSGKPVVTGFSQGGMLSFALALRHGELIHAAMPLSGMVPARLLETVGSPSPSAPATTPRIVALHGGADRIFAADGVRTSVAALNAKGITVEFYVYPGVGHEVSDKMREDIHLELAGMIAGLQAD
jgi:phospholipase/carboxylesterase